VAAPVDEERGCAGHAAQVRALHVLGDPVRPHAVVQVLGEASHVEPESLGVRDQIGQPQTVLVLEQQVVHLPERALIGGGLGGLLIAVGLVTPFAAAVLIAVMTVAVLNVHLRNGFFNTGGGFEYNLVLAAAAFSLAGIGAGDWSLDNALGIDLSGAGWALGALGAGILGGLVDILSARLASRRYAGEGEPRAASWLA